MTELQPIETAPRDGTQFLAHDGKRYAVLNWPPGCALGDWSELSPGDWRGGATSFKATNWMSLPEPQKESGVCMKADHKAALELAKRGGETDFAVKTANLAAAYIELRELAKAALYDIPRQCLSAEALRAALGE